MKNKEWLGYGVKFSLFIQALLWLWLFVISLNAFVVGSNSPAGSGEFVGFMLAGFFCLILFAFLIASCVWGLFQGLE